MLQVFALVTHLSHRPALESFVVSDMNTKTFRFNFHESCLQVFVLLPCKTFSRQRLAHHDGKTESTLVSVKVASFSPENIFMH